MSSCHTPHPGTRYAKAGDEGRGPSTAGVRRLGHIIVHHSSLFVLAEHLLAASSPSPKSIHVDLIGWRSPVGLVNRRHFWRDSFGKIQGQFTASRRLFLVCMIGASHQWPGAVGQKRGRLLDLGAEEA